MPEISATDAARRFSDLLDAIEHRREQFTILRRGHAIARMQPMPGGTGRDTKALLRAAGPDGAWADDLAAVRDVVTIDARQ